MDTLSREITSRFFANVEAYQHLRAHWRALMNSPRKHDLKAEHHLLYLALLGKDWRKGFSPITNPRKLANGVGQHGRLRTALNAIHYTVRFDGDATPLLQPFDGLVTRDMLVALHVLLPASSDYPCDAYLNTGATP